MTSTSSSSIPSKIQFGRLIAEQHNEGGTLYTNDKFIHFSINEWNKLFTHKLETKLLCLETIILDETKITPIHVHFHKHNNCLWLDIRHYYKNMRGEFIASQNGLRLTTEEWDFIKEWQEIL